MFKEIKERHEADSEMYNRVGKLHPMVISQSHKDRAKLLKLVDEAKQLFLNAKIETTGKHREDIEDFLSKLD